MRILVVDDKKNIQRTLVAGISLMGHEAIGVSSLEEALKAFKEATWDFVLTDFKLEGSTGLEVISATKSLNPPPLTAVMTAYASFENAVNAMKEGAYDYLPKPFSTAQLEHLLKRVEAVILLKKENELLKSSHYRHDFFKGQTSPAMSRIEEFVGKVAPTDASILLIGESGTGKTELAKLIHNRSLRASRSFSTLNCATLSKNLVEAELFGMRNGPPGKIETAHQGTLLIDEITALPVVTQSRLLRFLQEKVHERNGEDKASRADVRVIAATNCALEEAVKDGTFREDLYFHLNGFECALVPLRYRKDDLSVLIHRFYIEMSTTAGVQDAKPIPESVIKLLTEYSWSGNVRELRNTMERLVLLSLGREMSPQDLPDAVRTPRVHSARGGYESNRSLEEVERSHIERVLAVEGSQERAADILGITTVTLWRKRKQYGLP